MPTDPAVYRRLRDRAVQNHRNEGPIGIVPLPEAVVRDGVLAVIRYLRPRLALQAEASGIDRPYRLIIDPVERHRLTHYPERPWDYMHPTPHLAVIESAA